MLSGFNESKLKVNLKLAINRLKLLEKKKTEISQKARKEIADLIAQGKEDRARIRVEHIIREDYLVEVMEIVELYCDLLLARFGLIESSKFCEESLVEAVSTLVWIAPRLQSEVQELGVIGHQFMMRYGKEFAQQAKINSNSTVSERVISKLDPKPPSKVLVERYLVEICKIFNVAYVPNSSVMDPEITMPAASISPSHSRSIPGMPPAPFSIGFLPPGEHVEFAPPPSYQPSMDSKPPSGPGSYASLPQDRLLFGPGGMDASAPTYSIVNNLPSVPGSSSGGGGGSGKVAPDSSAGTGGCNVTGTEEFDFDDLTRRFEDLKKRK